MNTGELLEALRKDRLRDTSDIVSGSDDKLWSDDTLIRYLNDGYRRFCRQTLIIRDSSTVGVTQVRLREGQNIYDLHPKVLAVRSARYDTDNIDLCVASHYAIAAQYRFDGSLTFDVNTFRVDETGRPRAWALDESFRMDEALACRLRVYPVPTAAEEGKIVYLRTHRLPLNDLSLENLSATLEIPADYHETLLDWAAYRALSSIDVDGSSAGNAAAFKASFEAEIDDVKKEINRKAFAPSGPEFGRNGFSWTR